MFPLLVFDSLCWWGHAHVVIATIAQNMLTTDIVRSFNNIVSSSSMGKETIATCSTWQDEVKDNNDIQSMFQWHFADTPIVKPSFTGKLPNPTYNVTTYLESAWKTLTNPTTTDMWAWAFHLRSIIHFVGDVHTPHHNCAMFADIFPVGDYGGNFYTLNCNWGSACMNIHFLWDSVGTLYSVFEPKLPKYKSLISENAEDITRNYPQSLFTDLEDFNVNKWSSESNAVANEIGYATPMNEEPSPEYMRQMQDAAKKRVAMAGYRLGYVLKKLGSQQNYPRPLPSPMSTTAIVLFSIDAMLAIISIVFIVLVIRSQKKGDEFQHLI